MANYPTKSQITASSTVSIETKENQGSGKLIDGMVSEILTSSESHPHGIKVKLINGQIGRVKKVKGMASLQENTHVSDQANFVQNTTESTGLVDLNKKTIPKTEDTENEFKEFYQYSNNLESNTNEQARRGIMQTGRKSIAMTVSSFGNSHGGFVYIGIDKTGKIVGLAKDLKLGKFSNYGDLFANHIRDTLGEMLQDKTFIASKIRMKFRNIDDNTTCIIQVLPSNQPLFLQTSEGEEFYVRSQVAPRAEKMTGQEQFRYIKERFPNYG